MYFGGSVVLMVLWHVPNSSVLNRVRFIARVVPLHSWRYLLFVPQFCIFFFFFAKSVLHFTDFRNSRCGWVDFWVKWVDLGLRNVSMIRLYSECCGVSFHSEIRCPNWSLSLPDVRYGLAVGSCRVHLGWDCVLIWSSYSRVRGYCIVRCATPGLRSLRLFVVVSPSLLYSSRCLLFEPSHWGIISINLQLDSGLEFLYYGINV